MSILEQLHETQSQLNKKQLERNRVAYVKARKSAVNNLYEAARHAGDHPTSDYALLRAEVRRIKEKTVRQTHGTGIRILEGIFALIATGSLIGPVMLDQLNQSNDRKIKDWAETRIRQVRQEMKIASSKTQKCLTL